MLLLLHIYYFEYFWHLFLDSWYFCSLFQLLCGSPFCKFFSRPSLAAQPPLALNQGPTFLWPSPIINFISWSLGRLFMQFWCGAICVKSRKEPCAIRRPSAMRNLVHMKDDVDTYAIRKGVCSSWPLDDLGMMW